MANLWIYLTFTYAFLKSMRDCMKKAAVQKTPMYTILFLHTSLGLLLMLPYAKDAMALSGVFIFCAFLKAALCYTAWLLSLYALKKMPVGIFGILSLSGVVFNTIFSVTILGEVLTLAKCIGLLLVLLGLLLVNRKNESAGKWNVRGLIAVVFCCLFNSCSGVLDKLIMPHLAPTQLQFWFMFFLTMIAALCLVVQKQPLSFTALKTNYWIPLMSIALIVGDRLIFIAQQDPQSQLILITLINQSSILFTLLVGRLFFKERDMLYKLFCALLIVAGILLPLYLA